MTNNKHSTGLLVLRRALLAAGLIGLPQQVFPQTAAVALAHFFTFTTKSARPWREIYEQLQNTYNWRVSFEDVPIEAGGGEMGSSVTPTGITLSARRSRPVVINFATSSAQTDSTNLSLKRQVMQNVFAAHNASGNGGTFRAIYQGEFIHIVPTSFRDQNGISHDWQPLLDTKVTIPTGKYFLAELVSKVLQQIDEQRGTHIVLGTIPWFLMDQDAITEEANNETARDLLMRAFDEVNGPRLAIKATPVRMTWHILYEPRGKQYFFNIQDIELEPTSAPTENQPNAFISPKQ